MFTIILMKIKGFTFEKGCWNNGWRNLLNLQKSINDIYHNIIFFYFALSSQNVLKSKAIITVTKSLPEFVVIYLNA